MNVKIKHIHILRDSIVLYLHVENGNVNLKGRMMKISAIMLAMRLEQSKAEKKEKVCTTTRNTTKPTIKLTERR